MTDFFEDTEEDLSDEEAAEIIRETVGEYDEPASDFVQPSTRGPVAKRYQKKIKTVLNTIFRQTVAHEAAVPDAAAILMYGPAFSEKWGDLAAHDARVRKAIDMVLDGSENPYLAAAIATMPLLLQVYRNHEDALSPKGAVEAVRQSRKRAKEREPKRIRIPFTKRYMEFRFRLRVPAVQNMTNDPQQLAAYVFNNPDIIRAMQKAGIETIGGVNLNGDASQRSPTG
jgi:hypothetical protein